ncbi:hypothetical protein QQ008_18785 [Fulvivirgaceae bacterium BMA10]|uniref:Uncharacterized protein n=1 Tax=Splendidivirga corallicola TaxID=3051826 RepID=A0ABT8KRP1_9BACT|nr:hypothetical protein [Fulvivirgaceae bacterium BMA10]
MDGIIEFGKILLPAGVVLYAMYLVVKSFLNKEIEKKAFEVRSKNTETVLPIRLQAYERMCLFLERIAPDNLLIRLNDASYSSKHFQQILLAEIRNEFNHNLSQQIYMSDEAWELVRSAMEEIIATINEASGQMTDDAKSVDLAKKIIDLMMNKPTDPVRDALKMLKNEIRVSF